MHGCRAQGQALGTSLILCSRTSMDLTPSYSYVIDVKTLDAAGPTHMAVRHTDRIRLAAHRYVTEHSRTHEYGALPARMRLVITPIN